MRGPVLRCRPCARSYSPLVSSCSPASHRPRPRGRTGRVTRCGSRSTRSRSRRRSTSTTSGSASRATRRRRSGCPKGTTRSSWRLPGFRPVQRQITVKPLGARAIFALERQARPAVLDVKPVSTNDSATGAQLFVDGAPAGTVPARARAGVAGKHLHRGEEAGLQGLRDNAEVAEGESGTHGDRSDSRGSRRARSWSPSDLAGADVYVDGSAGDSTPALLRTICPRGEHTHRGAARVELPRGSRSSRVVGGQQQKVRSQLASVGAGRSARCAWSARRRAPRSTSTARPRARSIAESRTCRSGSTSSRCAHAGSRRRPSRSRSRRASSG